jgi:hypothetical protein
MKAYSYDNQGLYNGEVDRQYDELDQCWLMPASATETIPIEQEGKVNVWNGSIWELKDDNRGIYYNTINAMRVVINNPLDEIIGLTKIVPSEETFPLWDGEKWIEDIEKKKTHDNNIIKAELAKIDQERVRPLSEINNPDIIDKSYALAKIQSLEAQAVILRAQLQ